MDKHILGQNWLLLRGLARESGHWGEFPRQLQSAFPAANITMLDLPGTGRHYQLSSPETIPEITAFLRQQAQAENKLKQPFTVLALSMGAMVAWDWMLNYPQEINAGILVNTSFSQLSPFYRRLRWQSYYQFIKILLETDIDRREQAILKLVSNQQQHDQKHAEAWVNIQLRQPVSVSNSIRQIIAAASFCPTNKPSQPLLLINSRGDRLVAPACTDAIHNYWQIPVFTHSWAGHDLSLDDSVWLLNRLKEWLACYQ